MKKFIQLLLIVFAALSVAAEDLATLPMQEFLERARRRNTVATYAKLDGELLHRRRGAETLKMPVYFGVQIFPERTFGQLILNNHEGYILNLAADNSQKTVIPQSGKSSAAALLLDRVGMRAEDMMLGFLYCDAVRELERDTLRGVVSCRVFLLDDKKNREFVKVWISAEHAFPFRAEFIRYGENAPYRDLEAGALTRKNGLYYIRRIQLSGPGWSTRIDFDENTAEIAEYKSGVNIIRRVEK